MQKCNTHNTFDLDFKRISMPLRKELKLRTTAKNDDYGLVKLA